MLCPSCGPENRRDATFCDACSARLTALDALARGSNELVAGLIADFVGRRREMSDLVSAFDDAKSGEGRLVMLVGEPGIGKTRIAEEFAAHAMTQKSVVLWGRCHEQ